MFPHAHPVRIHQSPMQKHTLLTMVQSQDACFQQAFGSQEPGKLQRGSSLQGSKLQLPTPEWDYTSILLSCSLDSPCCKQMFLALTVSLQLLGPIAHLLLSSRS